MASSLEVEAHPLASDYFISTLNKFVIRGNSDGEYEVVAVRSCIAPGGIGGIKNLNRTIQLRLLSRKPC